MPKSSQSVVLLHIVTVPMTLGFLKGQVGYMKEKGLIVEAITSPGEFLETFAQEEQINVNSVLMLRQISPLQDIIAIIKLWKCLRKSKPQIVHASTPKGGLLGTIAAWLAGIPVRIYQIRGLPLMTANGFKRWLLWLSEKVACLLANQVLCNSHSLRKVALAENLCPEDKIKVLLGGSSNGVDAINRFNPDNLPVNARQDIRQQYGIPDEALVIGFVGRVVRDKGIVELTLAWQQLREEFSNLHWLVVGPFEAQDSIPPEIEQILKSDPRIHLTGINWNTPPFYKAMDILVLPTYREGFPNVPLEAASLELPVVATIIPGCVDAIADKVTGMLVPPKEVKGLVESIRMYLKDSDLRSKHGKAGRDRVLSQFRQEAIWEAIYEEYLYLLKFKDILGN